MNRKEQRRDDLGEARSNMLHSVGCSLSRYGSIVLLIGSCICVCMCVCIKMSGYIVNMEKKALLAGTAPLKSVQGRRTRVDIRIDNR